MAKDEQGFTSEHRQARRDAYAVLQDDSLDSVTAMRQAADIIEPHEPEVARKWRAATEVGSGNPVDYGGEPMPLADALMHIGGDLHRLAGTLKHEADTIERAGEDAGDAGMSGTEDAADESAKEQREAAEAVEAAAEAVEEAADDQREAADTAQDEAIEEAVDVTEDAEVSERVEEGNPISGEYVVTTPSYHEGFDTLKEAQEEASRVRDRGNEPVWINRLVQDGDGVRVELVEDAGVAGRIEEGNPLDGIATGDLLEYDGELYAVTNATEDGQRWGLVTLDNAVQGNFGAGRWYDYSDLKANATKRGSNPWWETEEAKRMKEGNPITPEGATVVGDAPTPPGEGGTPDPSGEPATEPPAEAIQHSAEGDTPPKASHWLTRPLIKVKR